MEDVFSQLVNGELAVHYYGAEQGQCLDDLLKDSEFDVDFDSVEDMTEAVAEKWPYYFVSGRIPNATSDEERVYLKIGPNAKIIDFEDFIAALRGEIYDEEINVDISEMI